MRMERKTEKGKEEDVALERGWDVSMIKESDRTAR